MISTAKKLLGMVLSCLIKDEFKQILKLNNKDGLVWLKAKCVEAVLMSEPPAAVLQKPPVKVWIQRVIDSEDTIVLNQLMHEGYIPDSLTELWALLEHPISAIEVVKFSPNTSEPLMLQLSVSNPKHRDLISIFMRHQGWHPDEDLYAGFIAWKRKRFPWLYNERGVILR